MSNASGVMGSKISIFESQAGPFAYELMSEFLKGIPLGETVCRARLALLKAKNLLGLVYILFAMVSLQLKAT